MNNHERWPCVLIQLAGLMLIAIFVGALRPSGAEAFTQNRRNRDPCHRQRFSRGRQRRGQSGFGKIPDHYDRAAASRAAGLVAGHERR
jgi:hypothetical protein